MNSHARATFTLQIAERHLRLDHPKLGQMARSIGVLRPKGRPEGVYALQRGGVRLGVELAAHRKYVDLPKKSFSTSYGSAAVSGL